MIQTLLMVSSMAKIDLEAIIKRYDLENISIATLASHSSLQIFHGARAEGLNTVAIVERSRLEFYRSFTRLINDFIVVDRWSDLCSERVVEKLRELNSIIVPHGSLVEYIGSECAESLGVPIFGLRSLYRVEASQRLKMDLLKRGKIPVPRSFSGRDLDDIDTLVIVKLPGAKGGRGYFLSRDPAEIRLRLKRLIDEGVISSTDDALIQEYVVGVTAYFHYFYSPILDRLEILGCDIRYESNVDGLKRLPNKYIEEIEPTFTVIGNIPMVLRESLLLKVYDYGMRFVNETKRSLPPGIIGPFCLESIVRDNGDIVVFEFSGRIVAGTNLYIDGSPYSWLYWDEPMSVGRRIAREIKMARDRGLIKKILT